MAYILEPQLFQKAIQIGNEEFGRKLSFGTNWQKVRIGMRCSLNGTGGITNAGFAIGLCQGTSNMYKSAICTDFMGGHFGGTIDNTTLSYTQSAPSYYSTTVPIITKVGGTPTNIGGAGSTAYLSAQPSTAVLGYVDILKGATNYSVTVYWGSSSTHAQTNSTLSNFITGMETDGTPPANVANTGSATFAYTGNGLMDTVNVAWNKSVPTWTIFNLAVCRFL